MIITPPVTTLTIEAPQQQVTIEVKYAVTRMNGEMKIFDTLIGPASSDWGTYHPYGPPFIGVVTIPLDCLSALKLGLVTREELMLPDAAEAFLHLIQPR